MKTQAGVHVSIATELNRIIDRFNLQAVGRLEQDVVFGDGTGKEVTSFFQEFPQLPSAIKACVNAVCNVLMLSPIVSMLFAAIALTMHPEVCPHCSMCRINTHKYRRGCWPATWQPILSGWTTTLSANGPPWASSLVRL